jgi:hypothetical protein
MGVASIEGPFVGFEEVPDGERYFRNGTSGLSRRPGLAEVSGRILGRCGSLRVTSDDATGGR